MDHFNDNQPDQHLNADNQPPEPPHAEDGPQDPAGEPPSLGEWLRVNGSTLLFMVLLIGAFVVLNEKYKFIGLDAAVKVAVGLGFIIFIHELGHFLVAKLCNVHVTAFSIGFGPALPFCSYTWGETTYKLAIFPLGGYVQMVGQVDLDEGADSGDDDPRSYKNKSVWQRMAIISAGVTMNAIFACVAFAAVFLINGKTRLAANVAAVESGKPAFTQGLRTGAEILRVNDIDHPYFDDLKYETIVSLGKIEIVAQRPGIDKEPIAYDITPHQGSMRLIGIQPASRLKLRPKKSMPAASTAPLFPNSAAAKADKAFEFDDVIVGVTNPDDPSKLDLPDDPRNPGGHMKDFFEFERRMTLLADKEVTIRVQRGEGTAKHAVDIKVPPSFHRVLDARMKMGQIIAVRDKSQAADPDTGVLIPRTTESGHKLEGDEIEKVEVTDADGKKIVYEKGKNLDPVRLPDQLKEWAARLWGARNNSPTAAERKVKLYLKRQSVKSAAPVFLLDPQVVELDWDFGWRFDRIEPMAVGCPEAIPELGLAYLVKNQVDGVKDNATESQLQKDDEIVDISFDVVNPDESITEGSWQKKHIKGTEWANLFNVIQAPQIVKVKVKVKRAGEEKELELIPRTDNTWPLADDRGLLLDLDTRTEKADNVLQAIGMGFRDTYRSIVLVYLNLRGFLAGTISVIDTLGGPLEIGKWAYRFAQADIWEFIFFLGLISVNLAVINFLPIPVLDGGHMVFLLYEKLRGKPASEGVRIGATYAGALLLGCLMIFVLALDIRRMVGG